VKVKVKGRQVTAASIFLDVTDADNYIPYPKFKRTKVSLHKGVTRRLYWDFQPANVSNTTLKFRSSRSAVATVDSSGEIITLKRGTTKISVKTSNGKSASITVVVR
jgi:uncharacterized protein YjdB